MKRVILQLVDLVDLVLHALRRDIDRVTPAALAFGGSDHDGGIRCSGYDGANVVLQRVWRLLGLAVTPAEEVNSAT